MASSQSYLYMQGKWKRPSRRVFGVILAAVVTVFSAAVLGGCGDSSSSAPNSNTDVVSSIVLQGVYVETQTGDNYALDFTSNGLSMYRDDRRDPTTGGFVGDCLLQGGQYTLVGNTVRASGGTLTQAGQAMTVFSPPSGGANVVLFDLVNDGQEIDLTKDNGTIIRFVKQ